MYHLIVYRSLTNPYARLVRICDGNVWDVTNEGLAAAPTWGDTDIALTKNSYIGGIPVTIPAALPAGEYDLLFYDAASPADTDEVKLGKRVRWTGSALLGLPIDI